MDVFRLTLMLSVSPPLIYYGLSIFSSWKFFRTQAPRSKVSSFAPPVSVLKPVVGVDHEAYENFASLCMQDYPEYEIVFCIDGPRDPIYKVLQELMRGFPQTRIRVLFGSASTAANDKVAKLARLTAEAQHEYLVIGDSDVRARPDYLRTLVAPLADPDVGAVTCFYLQSGDRSFTQSLQTVGMASDFYAGILTDWNLEGVKFTLGPTIATTRARLEDFGGYKSIDDRPADDLLVGQRIAGQGYKIELLPYCVQVVADYASISELLQKRLRWIVEMRHIRPWGHIGLLFTHGLLWWALATIVWPSLPVTLTYFAVYLGLRVVMTWEIGIRGLGRKELWGKLWMIPVWDSIALSLWITSIVRRGFRWRGRDYQIRNGLLIQRAAGVNVASSAIIESRATKQE
jgi:ceramide glucosyltransferase